MLAALFGIVGGHGDDRSDYVVHCGEIGPFVGLPDCGKALQRLGGPFGQIVELCHDNGLSCLPAIVVHKHGDRLPGDGFFDAFGECYGVAVEPGDSEHHKRVEPIQGGGARLAGLVRPPESRWAAGGPLGAVCALTCVKFSDTGKRGS